MSETKSGIHQQDCLFIKCVVVAFFLGKTLVQQILGVVKKILWERYGIILLGKINQCVEKTTGSPAFAHLMTPIHQAIPRGGDMWNSPDKDEF